MEAIQVRCKTCKHAMKFSAEKAGKRAKCPKCDTIVLIQAEEAAPQVKAAAAEAAAAEAAAAEAAAVVAAAPPEDDSAAGYGVFLDPELEALKKQREEEERLAAKKKRERKVLPKVARKVKAIPEAEAWAKVRFGLLFTFIGTVVWIATHILQGSYVVIGTADLPEYAQLIASILETRGGENDFPERGQFWDVDDLDIFLGMIAGREFIGYAKTCLVLASLLYLLQALCWGASYIISLPVPRRFATLGQLIAAMVLSFLNFLTMFFFKLLPVLGAYSWILVPFLTPEIVLTEYNMERVIPIHALWSGAPFWDNFLNLILKFCFYLQPTFGCIFIWTIGTAMKDEALEQRAKGLTQLSLGTFFTLFCFHMLSLCGASPVLVWTVRIFYGVWYCFLLLFMLSYAALILKCRAIMYEKIYPKNEL